VSLYTLDYPLNQGRKLVITYNVEKGEPGRQSMDNGDPGYPEEPYEIQVEEVRVWMMTDKGWLDTGITLDAIVCNVEFVYNLVAKQWNMVVMDLVDALEYSIKSKRDMS
jgi:hypothetical protein